MSNKIRKISIGSDYKNDAMHYSVGQEVYGGHTISDILVDENDNSYKKRKFIEKKLNTLSEEDFDSWGYKLQNEIDDLHSLLDWKTMTLQGLLDNLTNVVDYEGIEKYFRDVKQMDI